ncbi:hypothetical protein Pth03_31650 [Planotetraspora thailandica]|uniref:Uncharacterized protein n=1 Tax=Planotetraspora thailandica TaxID=487172 RepID=A0A8J3V154_9ACTN|nr:hypothetical protein [Planotetraspora thailandica]GII54776.1 hypothetical protein Pth03_31650 [Planotetraspora thailandica]
MPMRVVYRAIAGAVVVVVAGTVGTVVFLGNTGSAAPSAAAPRPSPLMASVAPASPSFSPSPTPTVPPLSPQMVTALGDARLARLPDGQVKLGRLPGRPNPTRGVFKDKRSGVSVPRFRKIWAPSKPSPFATRQNLPKVKNSPVRGMVVSCPVPIAVQENLKDTAFLAAGWTLNHQPKGATLTWTAVQNVTIGKRDAWVMGYNAHYVIKGKKHTSSAAVALVDVPGKKPALVFVTIPDTQKRYWRDINTVMSGIKVP